MAAQATVPERARDDLVHFAPATGGEQVVERWGHGDLPCPAGLGNVENALRGAARQVQFAAAAQGGEKLVPRKVGRGQPLPGGRSGGGRGDPGLGQAVLGRVGGVAARSAVAGSGAPGGLGSHPGAYAVVRPLMRPRGSNVGSSSARLRIDNEGTQGAN